MRRLPCSGIHWSGASLLSAPVLLQMRACNICSTRHLPALPPTAITNKDIPTEPQYHQGHGRSREGNLPLLFPAARFGEPHRNLGGILGRQKALAEHSGAYRCPTNDLCGFFSCSRCGLSVTQSGCVDNSCGQASKCVTARHCVLSSWLTYRSQLLASHEPMIVFALGLKGTYPELCCSSSLPYSIKHSTNGFALIQKMSHCRTYQHLNASKTATTRPHRPNGGY